MSNYGNLEISGAGSLHGGRFDRVLIEGSGKITGDLECDSFEVPGAGKVEGGSLTVHGPIEIDGASKVEGAVWGESLEVNGSFQAASGCEISGDAAVDGSFRVEGGPCTIGGDGEVDGSFQVEEGPCAIGGRLEIDGSFQVGSDLSVGALEVDGNVSVQGSVRAAGDIDVDGVFKAGGEVQAEAFRATGTVRIDGLLNAETVKLTLCGEDRIASIGGGRVTVERGRSGFFFSFKNRPRLVSELIEADEIELEATDCQIVRGDNVRIGPECVIDRVEFRGSLTTAANCTVREKVRV